MFKLLLSLTILAIMWQLLFAPNQKVEADQFEKGWNSYYQENGLPMDEEQDAKLN